MIKLWMRWGRAVKPWVVATALACGFAAAGPACDEADPLPDDASDVETARDGDVGFDADGRPDCTPAAYYGPMLCWGDDDYCERTYGPGSTCSSEVSDGCGGWYGACSRPSDAGVDARADADARNSNAADRPDLEMFDLWRPEDAADDEPDAGADD